MVAFQNHSTILYLSLFKRYLNHWQELKYGQIENTKTSTPTNLKLRVYKVGRSRRDRRKRPIATHKLRFGRVLVGYTINFLVCAVNIHHVHIITKNNFGMSVNSASSIQTEGKLPCELHSKRTHKPLVTNSKQLATNHSIWHW